MDGWKEGGRKGERRIWVNYHELRVDVEERMSVFLSVVSVGFICGGGVLWVRGSKEGGEGQEG